MDLTLYQTQQAIALLKGCFQRLLSKQLNLTRVSAPLFVSAESGLNDDLNGVERAVSFDIPDLKTTAEVVHSLAKWKRLALKKYEFPVASGIYTDMNAIRRDEKLDELHSIYVDQWDWEKIITKEDRTIDYLKKTVQQIVSAIVETSKVLKAKYKTVVDISPEVTFITSQELEDLYPTLTPEEREQVFVKTHPTTFILQIGGVLKSGKAHDGRAPDYDDWELNGDLLFWHSPLNKAVEISSMGIRVDKDALLKQLTIRGCKDRLKFDFHQMIVENKLPLTIGGGIGQSRLSMLLLGKKHIGEVQVSLWSTDTESKYRIL